jgi:hypothetical protein
MFRLQRRALVLTLTAFAALMFAVSASAQIDCSSCDPYSSHCSDDCYICRRPGQDPGQCGTYIETTCGDDRVLGGNCLQDGCTPSFQTTERVSIGFYGETLYGVEWAGGYWRPTWACAHHTVDRVTQHDFNQCNANPYWWDKQFCDDYVDYQSYYYNDHIPNCCAYPAYCNGWHSCF